MYLKFICFLKNIVISIITAVVEGKSVGVCLGDLFSINWMNNTELVDKSLETLQE